MAQGRTASAATRTGMRTLHTLMQRMRRGVACLSLVPVDHYTALRIATTASDAEIEAAYRAAIRCVTRSRRAWVAGYLMGRSPARLRLALDELSDPVVRAAYDCHLEQLRAYFEFPPH